MANFAENFLATFVPGFNSSFQQARNNRSARSQAEFEAQQLQDRERQALVRTLLGDENVAASAKNQLLASILPQFRQQTEVTTTVPGVQATAKPVQLGRELVASAPSNLPTEADLPQSGVYNEQMGEHVNLLNRLGAAPTAQMIDREAAARDKFSSRTPVGMPTAPRGSLSSEVSLRSGPDSQETKTVTTPMEVFQDKVEKKTIDPVLTEAGQTIFKLYQEGKVPEAAVREFLPSYQEALRTGDFSKLKLPTALTQTADAADENKLKKIQLDLQNRGLDIQRKTLELEQKRLDKETPFALGDKGTDLTLKLADRAEKQSQDYQVVVDNIANINAAINRLHENPGEINRIATDEAVVTSFKKILDPSSVVRESEYDRTEQNQALVNRAQGWFRKLAKGGTTLTMGELEEMQATAQAMAELRRDLLNKKLDKLRTLGKARGLNPDEFAPTLAPIGNTPSGGSKQNTAPTGPDRYKDYIRNQLNK